MAAPTKIQPVTGARDWYPEQMRFRNWLFNKMREVSERFGYEEYDGPFLEPFELFAMKSGEELVNEQMYIIEDRGKPPRRMGIRPEMTPSLARMVAQKSGELRRPVKWFSIPALWRYERPQRGRVREFWQYNIDVLGVADMTADAEIVAVAVTLLRELGLTENDFVVRINNRRYMNQALERIGLGGPEVQATVFKAIDKRDRMTPDAFRKWLGELGFTGDQITALQNFLDTPTWTDCAELDELFHLLKVMDVDKYCDFDPSIVRGLAYYTGTVFEIWDKKRELRAIAGAGRYDDLVGMLGGGKGVVWPGVGMGMGELPLTLLLERCSKLPRLGRSVDYYVANYSAAERDAALQLATRLRNDGFQVDTNLAGLKLDRQLRAAEDAGARFTVILGPAELAKGLATVKNMETREQETLPLDQIGRHT